MANKLKNELHFKIDCLTAVCIIANIQLATRHKENLGPSRKIAEAFARELGNQVIEINPDFAEMIALGWDPENDFDATGYGDKFKSGDHG